MSLSTLIKKLDEVDKEIREELKTSEISVGERFALEQARSFIQRAITPMLKYL